MTPLRERLVEHLDAACRRAGDVLFDTTPNAAPLGIVSHALPDAVARSLHLGTREELLTLVCTRGSVYLGNGLWTARHYEAIDPALHVRGVVLPLKLCARAAWVTRLNEDVELEAPNHGLAPLLTRELEHTGERIREHAIDTIAFWRSVRGLDDAGFWRSVNQLEIVARPTVAPVAGFDRKAFDAADPMLGGELPRVAVEPRLLANALRALGVKEAAKNVRFFRGPTKHSPVRIDVLADPEGQRITARAVVASLNY